jgi:hypothetical protein
LPVIGVLGAQSADDYKNVTVGFLQSLKETGYVVGQNVAVEYQFAENQLDQLPALAADLVRSGVAVILASGTAEALAAKAATMNIPSSLGHLEKLISVAIADLASVNTYESEREQSRIIRRQICGARPVGAIFRGALWHRR